MAEQEITKLSDAERRRISKNKRARTSSSMVLPDGQRYAVVALGLAAEVDTAEKRATIRNAIAGITGVQAAAGIAFGQADVDTGETHQTVLHIGVHEREDPVPAEPE